MNADALGATPQAVRTPRTRAGRAENDVLGVVLLDAEHYAETLGWDDPSAWVPPPGLGPGFLSHPAYWSLPVVFAVARGATSEAAAERRPEAIRGVVEAVRRLDGRCRMIVGTCGHFGHAWAELYPRPRTPTILSALDVLDDALRWSRRDVLVLTTTTASGRRSVADTPGSTRVRVLGMDGAGDWSRIDRPDWVRNRDWSEDGLEAGLREVLDRESRPGGALEDVGCALLSCTILPQFTAVIREYTDAPIVHVGSVVETLLSAS
jgi:hypothetical protein